MGSPIKNRGFAVAAAIGLSMALLLPAQAQFWDWGGRPQRQQQRDSNPFGGWFSPSPRWDGPRYERPSEREAPADSSRAPGPERKKAESTNSIVVVGDANADWLAYGLEDAFSEKPEIGIVRKHRTDSGLIQYDQRRDIEWPQVAREIIATEKPNLVVMMIGNNDRQTIREKAPPPAPANAQPPQPEQASPAPPPDPERQPVEQQHLTPAQARQAAYGPWEFQSEKWEHAY